MSGLPPFNVRRPHILANIFYRQGAGSPSGPRPLFSIVAQSCHAYEHNVLRPD